MKIIDRKTFLAMPEGTVFAKYEPIAMDELQIKCANAGTNDFWSLGLTPFFTTTGGSDEFFDVMMAVEKGVSSPPFDYEDGEFRDGLFDDDQLFAVFERHDVEALIGRFQKALSDGYAVIA